MDNLVKTLLTVGCFAGFLATLTLVIVFISNIKPRNIKENIVSTGYLENFADIETCQYWSLSSAQQLSDVSKIVCFSPSGAVAVVVNAAKTQSRCMFSEESQTPFVDVDTPRVFNEGLHFYALSNSHVLTADGTTLNLHAMDIPNNIVWSGPVVSTVSTTTAVAGVWFLFGRFVVFTIDRHVTLYDPENLTQISTTTRPLKINLPIRVFNNGNDTLCFWHSTGKLDLVDLNTAGLDVTSFSPPGLTQDNVLQLALSPDARTLVACVYSDNLDDCSMWMWNHGKFQDAAVFKNVRDPAPWQARNGYGMFVVSNDVVIVPSVTVSTFNFTLTNFNLPTMHFETRQLDIASIGERPVPAAELLTRFASSVRSSTSKENSIVSMALDTGYTTDSSSTVVRFFQICNKI